MGTEITYGRMIGTLSRLLGAGAAGNARCPVRNNPVLRGSTLAETLVMMVVAGLLFLAVMDGLTLFTRLQTRRAEMLLANSRLRDGFWRIERLAASADSLTTDHAFHSVSGASVVLWRNGRTSRLVLRDSALLFTADAYCDTLLQGITALRLLQQPRSGGTLAADTLEIGIGKHTLKFPVHLPERERYETSLEQIENGHEYE